MTRLRSSAALIFVAAAIAATTTGCEIGGKSSSQRGFRGTGMVNLYDKSELAAKTIDVATGIPKTLAPVAAPAPGEPAPQWKNVQVLKDVSAAELSRTMIAMSQWVTGGTMGNCAYCHNVAAPWDDTMPNGQQIYTKIVARRMLQMVRNINNQYSGHVVQTGVTCYTCHLGKPLPNGLWFYTGANQLERYFLDRDGIRIQTHTVAASNDNRSSAKQAEWTYALMIKMSTSLGVSCNHCHNSRAFWSWEQAPPQRAVALIGAQMVRDLNQNYLSPLQPVFPPIRKGAMGDAPKLQCLTCHNGAYKPLYAYPMAKDYPALWGRSSWAPVTPAVAAPAEAAPAASATTTAPAPASTPAPVASKTSPH